MILHHRTNRPDPYRLAAQALGVQPGAGEDDVKKAYRSTAQKFHPDRHTGEGKDEVYAARFNLATCAKTLLLARGSADERKALDAFTQAKNTCDVEMRKAGITPTPAQEAPSKPASAQPSGSGQKTQQTGSDFYTRRPSAGAKRGPTFDDAKKWTPPEFDTSAHKWNGNFWQSPAGDKSQAKASTRATDGFEPFSFSQAKPRQEAPRPQQEAPRASAGPRPEDVRPSPSATTTVSPQATSTPQQPPTPDPRARAAAAAYGDAMSGFTTGSRVDRWV